MLWMRRGEESQRQLPPVRTLERRLKLLPLALGRKHGRREGMPASPLNARATGLGSCIGGCGAAGKQWQNQPSLGWIIRLAAAGRAAAAPPTCAQTAAVRGGGCCSAPTSSGFLLLLTEMKSSHFQGCAVQPGCPRLLRSSEV